MHTTPTLREALFIKSLSLIPKHEKIALLTHILDIDQTYLAFHGNQVLSADQLKQYLLLAEKLQQGVPLQYLTKQAFFYGLSLYVDSRVLIPRPETEIMVETVIQNFPDAKTILDVGTGSGAISKALAVNLPKSQVTALDICPDALQVAQRNLQEHSNINLIQSDLLSEIHTPSFDVICANLPYIGTEEFAGVDKSVIEHEPKKALFAGPDGLDLYRRLFTQIRNKNIQFQVLYIELADNQSKMATQVAQLLLPNTQIKPIKDLNQKIRFLEIKPQ